MVVGGSRFGNACYEIMSVEKNTLLLLSLPLSPSAVLFAH